MPHPDEPSLVAYVASHSSATALAVYDTADRAAAGVALRAAAAEILAIRHPDEPDATLPNWCEVLDDDDGVPVLHLDMKDEIRYAALVVRIVLDQLAAAGVEGRLEPKRQPLPYDANADLYTGMEPLWALDERDLPPGFPADFPVPEGAVLALAQRCRDGRAEHAAWRRSTGPFAGYLERLRAYGCTFGEVPRLLTVGGPPDLVRYTLWRAGAGGGIALFRSSEHWYVSVVWQASADPPATPVDPSEEPDARPVPTGSAAARELAEFLVPAALVDGYETLVALATAAHALRHRPGRRMPPSALDPAQLSVVRHVCLTMVANVLATGRRARPAGLTLVTDEDGHLYAADLRERGITGAVETSAVLVQGVQLVTEAMPAIRTEPVKPPADRYAWLFDGLTPEQLAAARDACWQFASGHRQGRPNPG